MTNQEFISQFISKQLELFPLWEVDTDTLKSGNIYVHFFYKGRTARNSMEYSPARAKEVIDEFLRANII